MATYADFKDQFRTFMRRKDITDSQIDQWVRMALQRITRNVASPRYFNQLFAFVYRGVIALPRYIVRVYVVTGTDGDVYRYVDWADLDSPNIGFEKRYAFHSPLVMHVRPIPNDGTILTIGYIGDFTQPTTDTADWPELDWMRDALLYGTLQFACESYFDERASLFAQRFQQTLEELGAEIHEHTLTHPGVSISPACDTPF